MLIEEQSCIFGIGMRKPHDVIYIPGIGDDHRGLQAGLIKTWRLYGVRPYLHEMPWMDNEQFAPKFERLLARIDELSAKGHVVSLVAASAGAGAGINAFAARKDKINGIVCICGKVNNPEAIGKSYYRSSPAFPESAFQVQGSLDQLDFENDRSRIQSRYAIFDQVVQTSDSEVVGGHNQTVPTIGHATTIVTQLVFGAPFFIRFLKQTAK